MNLRKNNGFSGIDVTIAVVIILIIIPTAFGFVYNLSNYRAKVQRFGTSINLAVEVIEEAKGQAISVQDLDDVESFINDKYSLSGNTAIINKNNTQYKLEVTFENPTQYVKDDITTHLVKKVTAQVTYPIGKDTKEIEISRLLKVNLDDPGIFQNLIDKLKEKLGIDSDEEPAEDLEEPSGGLDESSNETLDESTNESSNETSAESSNEALSESTDEPLDETTNESLDESSDGNSNESL